MKNIYIFFYQKNLSFKKEKVIILQLSHKTIVIKY